MRDEVLQRAVEGGAFQDLRAAFEEETTICSKDVRTIRAIIERAEALLGRVVNVDDVLTVLGWVLEDSSETMVAMLVAEVLRDPFAAPGALRKRADARYTRRQKERAEERREELAARRRAELGT